MTIIHNRNNYIYVSDNLSVRLIAILINRGDGSDLGVRVIFVKEENRS